VTHTRTLVSLSILLAVVTAGCGDASQGRSPSRVVIANLAAAPGGTTSSDFGNPLSSDVLTNVKSPDPCSATTPCPTIFNDLGQVTMRLVLKDPGVPGLAAAPSDLNQVTFTRYRVEYKRTDGRAGQGVDVPYAFDSGLTFTVPSSGDVTMGFELVRSVAKQEAPLKALVVNGETIATIATVTFYGQDLAGNNVTASGNIAVTFSNFGD
jgi:hypothetical protein